MSFDNFDRYIDTLTGQNVLHDTNGIVFQNVADNGSETHNIQTSGILAAITEVQQRRRKYVSSMENTIETYIHKNKLLCGLSANVIQKPNNLERCINLDNIWMFQHAFNTNDAKQ